MWPWVVTAWSTGVPLGLISVVGFGTLSFRATHYDAAATEALVISAYFIYARKQIHINYKYGQQDVTLYTSSTILALMPLE
jgi:hypothetical protein